MKKYAVSLLFLLPFMLMFVFFFMMFAADDGGSRQNLDGLPLSPEVLQYRDMVEHYAAQYGISDYVIHLLAIMQVESGGRVPDVMQSSESLGLPPNSLNPEQSIKQGAYYFSSLLENAFARGCDVDTAIQSYNYGGGFTLYVNERGKKYSLDHAIAFARDKSGGVTIKYTDSIAVKHNGGWMYRYGNMFYVPLVKRYLYSPSFSDETAQAIFTEALKYQGWKYVFGGSSPATSFDCSGLTQWCYKAAGLSIPRIAQAQYDAMEHIPLADAKPGDLVFFHSTYSTSDYITHVGIYVGGNRMYHAGNPIGYADLGSAYWTSHFVSAGRYKG